MKKSSIAIQIKSLSKTYKMYAGRKDFLWELILRKKKHVEKQVLSDISLEIKRGEIVGILGRNGAGKSTLLKLIAGTLNKTSGIMEVKGRLTAILELGSGFQAEYTGRENIYMGGMCLGMSRKEIDSKIDEIIEFSELENYIDQPFRTYSTGMQARLTFSTAISVDPDILIVDEALSVGDARFQAKCFGKLNKLRDSNVTILLVSHDTGTITSLCDRAIILEDGKIYSEGNSKEITVQYQKLLFGGGGNRSKELSDSSLDLKKPQFIRYGTNEAKLQSWGMFDGEGNQISYIETGAKFSFKLAFICEVDLVDLSFGFAIKDVKGTVLWGIGNLTACESVYVGKEGEIIQAHACSTMWLAAGHYSVTVSVAHWNGGEKIDHIEDAIIFRVLGPGKIYTTSIVNLDTQFKIISQV